MATTTPYENQVLLPGNCQRPGARKVDACRTFRVNFLAYGTPQTGRPEGRKAGRQDADLRSDVRSWGPQDIVPSFNSAPGMS